MDSGRAAKAVGVFLVLSMVFSGAVGLVAAAADPDVFVPLPMPGDSARYVVRQVIDDEGIAKGSVRFDWARLTWLDETTITDETGVPMPAQPARFEIMFYQGTKYEIDAIRTSYYDPASGHGLMDEYGAETYIEGQDPYFCAVRCVGGYYGSDADVRVQVVPGPVGLCGARTPLHGAIVPPETMDLEGYCRALQTMGDETTTAYRLVDHTVWKDRDAVVYEAPSTGYRITYAEGIPMPVALEIPLAENIYEPYTLGRHYSLELDGYVPGKQSYPVRPPRVLNDPLPLVARDPLVHIDDSALPGFGIAEAYQAALSDTASPRLSDFLQRPGAYLGAAWRDQLQDADGNVYHVWSLFATDGDRELGKTVTKTVSASPLGGPASLLSPLEQYDVQDVEYETGFVYPAESRLPAEVPSVPAALARSAAYPGVRVPNFWGFYAVCSNEACTDVSFQVLAGEEHVPSGTPAVGIQGNPPISLYMSAFDKNGLMVEYTSIVAGGGSDPLLPLSVDSGPVPNNDGGAQGAAVWSPPSGAAVASLGILAVLGAALYYFWPAFKIGGVGLFTRIRDDRLLDHPQRRRIQEVVRAEPGIHFKDLERCLGIGRGALEHHLRKLQAAGLVVRQEGRGYTCIFPKGAVDRRVMEVAPLVRSASARRVFSAIAEEPGTTCSDVAEVAGLAPATVSYHLGRFRKNGLVGPGRSLRLTEQGETVYAAVAS